MMHHSALSDTEATPLEVALRASDDNHMQRSRRLCALSLRVALNHQNTLRASEACDAYASSRRSSRQTQQPQEPSIQPPLDDLRHWLTVDPLRPACRQRDRSFWPGGPQASLTLPGMAGCAVSPGMPGMPA